MSIFGIGLPGEGKAAAAGRQAANYQNMQNSMLKQILQREADPMGLASQTRDRILASAQSGMSRLSENPNVNMSNLASILKQRAAAQGSSAFNDEYNNQLQKQIATRLQMAGLYGNMADSAFNRQQIYNQQSAASGAQIGQLLGYLGQYGPAWMGK